jgi:hypothetical protein
LPAFKKEKAGAGTSPGWASRTDQLMVSRISRAGVPVFILPKGNSNLRQRQMSKREGETDRETERETERDRES